MGPPKPEIRGETGLVPSGLPSFEDMVTAMQIRAESDGNVERLRERRLRFYLRSGYRKTELTSRVFGVEYRILEIPTAAEHSAEELRSAYTEIYRSTLPAFFFRTQFRVSSADDRSIYGTGDGER